MKDNLENVFKEKFENFEADFDANAWEAMNKRLDAAASKGSANSNSWYWAAATIGALVVAGSLFYFLNDETTVSQEILSENRVLNDDKIITNVVEEDKINPTEPENIVDNQLHYSDAEIETTDPTVVSDETTSETVHQIQHTNSTDELVTVENKIEEQTSSDSPSEKTQEIVDPLPHKSIDVTTVNSVEGEENTIQPRKRRFISGVVEQKTPALDFVSICVGEPLIIKNPSEENETVRVAYNNREIDIPAGQYTQLSLSSNVTINFLNENNEVIHQQDVVVSPTPQVDFTYEANIYEEGLPVVKLESYNNNPNTEWSINEKTVTGSNPTVNLFEKGEYEVTMFLENENGCSTTKTRTITIDENYNLMAVSAFKPNDADPRNRTFMPFSLTQRDVQFTLTIIDPNDNGVVFTSKDASHAWDGTDTRTGKMTKSEKIFMWKVQLENPLPNENSVYIGTVTHH